MKEDLTIHTQTVFEQIKKFDDDTNEFWSARELGRILEYSQFRHFIPVIERAKEACKNSGVNTSDHFEDVLTMVPIGSGAANLFRATQTEEKLRREEIKGKDKANKTHFEVGAKVRKTIEDIGGTMPENLPVADSIKKLDKAFVPLKLRGE